MPIEPMPDPSPAPLPPSLEKALRTFRALGREEKMQALVSWSKRLEPLPPHIAALDRSDFSVPECQTRVEILPEVREGRVHFYADVNVRQSPTIAAFLAIVFAAVNDQPPAVTLAIPPDFVPAMMQDLGLGAREVGLTAMVARLQDYARRAAPG
jgi:cysteine desulfuration protein SufE